MLISGLREVCSQATVNKDPFYNVTIYSNSAQEMERWAPDRIKTEMYDKTAAATTTFDL